MDELPPAASRPASGRRVAAAEIAAAFLAIAVLAATLLPSVAPYREGAMLTVLLLVTFGLLWFHILPRDLLGPARSVAGGAVIVALVALLLLLTGGAESPYFPLYIVSVLGSVFAVRPWATVATGAGAILAYALIVAFDSAGGRLAPGMVDRASLGILGLGGATAFGALNAHALRRSRDELVRRYEELAARALTDPLTGLRTRAVLDEHAGHLHALAERSGRSYGVLALDLDELKRINDSRGHEAGDLALRTVASAIRAGVRTSDVAMRTGGDEFVVLLPDATAATARQVAERIRAGLRRLSALPVSVSMGVAAWSAGRSPEAVRGAADAALYRAKTAGGDQIVVEGDVAGPPA